jgi:hypothetical protein
LKSHATRRRHPGAAPPVPKSKQEFAPPNQEPESEQEREPSPTLTRPEEAAEPHARTRRAGGQAGTWGEGTRRTGEAAAEGRDGSEAPHGVKEKATPRGGRRRRNPGVGFAPMGKGRRRRRMLRWSPPRTVLSLAESSSFGAGRGPGRGRTSTSSSDPPWLRVAFVRARWPDVTGWDDGSLLSRPR